MGGLIFTAMLVAFYVKARLFGRLTATDAILPMIFLTLLQFESLVIVPMPAHGAMPLLLVMPIALSWSIEQPLARYSAITR